MEKDRGTRTLAVIALLVAVVGMTIGFAAFSTTLTIEGTGTVKASKFSVIFENLMPAVATGTAKEASGGTPTIQPGSTVIRNYNVELTTPGDSISYTFDIANRGTYDATITGITMAGRDSETLTVTGTGDTATADEDKVKPKLEYTLKYAEGDNAGQDVAVNDELAAGASVKVTLTLRYATFNDQSLLPANNVTIGNLGISIVYGQS